MTNTEIRQEIKKHRLRNYEVAREIGISEFTFSRWLRDEMNAERRERVKRAIEKLARENFEVEGNDHDRDAVT